MTQVALNQLNASPRDAFVAALGGVYEHSPWVAERAYTFGPFASPEALAAAMRGVVNDASADEQLALIRAHPDLVGRLARQGRLTVESTAEQRAAGLTELTPDEAANFERYNATYRERFGFPFVICARQNPKDAILAAFPIRLQKTADQERATALAEVHKIAGLRLGDLVLG